MLPKRKTFEYPSNEFQRLARKLHSDFRDALSLCVLVVVGGRGFTFAVSAFCLVFEL